jgi:hypothetical protein
MGARIIECTAAEYHADAFSATPTLSRSVALEMVKRSAYHGKRMHPRLGAKASVADDDEDDDGDTRARDDGSVYHALLLAPHEDPREVVYAENVDKKTGEVKREAVDKYTTKAAREARDAIRARGKIPTKLRDYEWHTSGAQRFRESLAGIGIMPQAGDCEVAIEFDDEGVLCRARLDNVHVIAAENRVVIYDYKFMKDGSAEALYRSAIRLGYDMEAHAHTMAIEKARPEYAGRVEFVLVACELNTWLCTPHPIGGTLAQLGRVRWERAREMWRHGLATGDWPGYAPTVLEARPYDLEAAGAEL